MALPSTYSVYLPVEVVASGGILVRQVDTNGTALDDATDSYSVAMPVMPVDSTGTNENGSRIFGTHLKVTIDPNGWPIIRVDPNGNAVSNTLTTSVISNASTFDTTIGNGVDSAGFAALPLRAGAKYIYLNSSTGSDANSGLTTSLPKATLAAACALITNGAGDQVLIAEGTTYAVAIDSHVGLTGKGGFNKIYPTVLQSYDSTDPTNTAKYGRATGNNRPKFTGIGDSYTLVNGGPATSYMAFRGLELNPGAAADGAGFGGLGTAAGQHNYILMENNKFFYTQVTWDMAAVFGTPGFKYIVRNCSFYGQWSSGGNAQGYLCSYVDGVTIEDCVFYHCGWKPGVLRSALASAGGPTNLSHPIYAQDETRNNVVRRCAFVDNAADGGRIKGGGLYQNNLVLSNPIGLDNGGGNNYVLDAPLGVWHDIAGNVIMGGKTINGSTGGGWFAHTVNGKQGSSAHHNIGANSTDPASANGFMIDAKAEDITDASAHPTWSPAPVALGLPAYTDWNSNILYNWNVSGNTKVEGLSNTPDLTKIHTTYNNNVWPDATSGTNTNVSSVSFTNAYTITSLLAAINASYTDLTTAATDWVNNPDQHGWKTGVTLAKAGYGVSQPLVDLKTIMQVTVGIPDTGMFIGVIDGSILTASGLPTGFTLDSDCRTWRYDGTGTANTGSVTITETNGTSSHNTVFSWSVSARPILSSLTVTSSTTATISTDTGNGILFWAVTDNSTSPDWTYLRAGLKPDLSNTAKAFGQQTISGAGTQNLTGLSAMTAGNYLHVAQLGSSNNPSTTSSIAASSWTPASLGAGLIWWAEPKPANLTKLGGGTPVDGDQVSAITDLSGNSITLSQATTGQYPIYHTDGTHYWLTYDGVNDSLGNTSSIVYTDGSGQHTTFATVKPSSTSGVQSIIDTDNITRLSQNLRTNAGTLESVAFNTSVSPFSDAGPSVGSGTVHVISEKTTTTTVEAFVDGTGNGSASITGTPQSAASNLYVGSHGGSTQNYAGNWYGGFIYKGVMGSTDLSSAQTYMRALAP